MTAAAAAVIGLVALGMTAAQPGQLTQVTGPGGCISQLDTSGACVDGRALNSPGAVAVAPDGRSVYVGGFGGVGNEGGGIAHFSRNSSEGRITQRAGPAGCISNAVPDCGTARAMEGVSGVEVSPDGRNLYATGFLSGSVLAFRRSASGDLTQLPGSTGCVNDDGADGCGDGNGLSGAAEAAASRDGRNVYIASYGSDAVAVFARDAGTGRLRQLAGASGCVQQVQQPDGDGEQPVEDPVSQGCSPARGLVRPIDLVVSPDGRNVYSVSFDALGIFRRSASGALTQLAGPAGCFSRDGSGGTCTQSSSLDLPLGMAISPDGLNVYVAAYGGETSGTIVAFRRDPATGRLTSLPAGSPGVDLDSLSDVAVTPDGTNVYAVSPFRGAVLAFRRNPDGRLAALPRQAACVSDVDSGDDCARGNVLARASALAVSLDGRNVYITAVQPGGGSEVQGPQFGSLSVFRRESPLILSLSRPRVRAPSVRAGKEFSISARVTINTGTGSVTLSCTAKAGIRTVRTSSRYSSGAATCAGVVPQGVAGKRLTGTIRATVDDVTKTAGFSFLIKR